ncbi:uncharacterized protein LOC128128107 [Lactuca sativa]|uniref:uncharacterized protein LOC128128107 n=1 Tax=Lactuca sativa TaxID=4236 RepID=UPI0022AF1644|nr:uncharacterized protein LOC128128107 [Lactuca sativa]
MEDEEEESEEEEEEEELEEEVFTPPYIARVPANHVGYNGPKPHWATMIERWSRQQCQRSPYGDQRGYYELSHRGPANRPLPVMVQHITNLGNQSREMADQVRNLNAVTEATDARTRELERDFYPVDQLIEDLVAARAEVDPRLSDYTSQRAFVMPKTILYIDVMWTPMRKMPPRRSATCTERTQQTNSPPPTPQYDSVMFQVAVTAAVAAAMSQISTDGARRIGSGINISTQGDSQGRSR